MYCILRPVGAGSGLGILLLLGQAVGFGGSTELTPVPFQEVRVQDAFWSPRIKTNQAATIEANLRECEITGRIRNFAVAGKLERGKHEGALYNDSDVYKMIEGIA